MWMNVVVIFILIIIVLATNSQGLFTNVLQLACTVAAGAIAFAFWEPIYFLAFGQLDKPLGYDFGWGVTLLLTFAIARIILLTISDKACPANVFVADQPNWIGGGIVGAMNAIIITGMLVIGIQFTQGPTALLGYQAWRIDSDGSIRREDKLWIPVDEIVEFIYSEGSKGPMFVPYPMAELQPDLAQQASLFRTSYGDGASRMGMRPDGVTATRLISVAPPDPGFIQSLPGVTDPRDYERLNNGDLYVVRTEINNATWDEGTKLRLSKGQIRLVVEMPNGDYLPVHPHAFYQKAVPDLAAEFRFEFDVNDVFATSVGVGAETKIGFEFLVPPAAIPQYIILRNIRSQIPTNVESMSLDELENLARQGEF